MGIKEIARLAGVSIATVDRVIHNRGRVSMETKERIEELIHQYNYKPNLLARSLKAMQRKTIALLVPNPEEDEYWRQAWEGFESEQIKAEHYGIYLKPYLYSLTGKDLFNKYSREILGSRPDGLIMAPNYLREGKKLFHQCAAASIPVIMFDTIPPDTDRFCFIGTDSYQSGRLGAQLLSMISETNGELAIIHFDEVFINSPHMIEKERGFKSYLMQTDRPFSSFEIKISKNYEKRLDSIFTSSKIAGVFVSTSKTFIVGRFLERRQIKSVKLVGFDLISDNIRMMKAGYINFLINQNPRRQAAESLDLMIDKLIYSDRPGLTRPFPIEVITLENLNSYS